MSARELWWRRRLSDLTTGVLTGVVYGGVALVVFDQSALVALGAFAALVVGALLVVPLGRKAAGEPSVRELAAREPDRGSW